MKIMCWLESEDYWHLDGLSKKDEAINFYGYMMNVSESDDDANVVNIMVIEMQTANMSVGFVVVKEFKVEGDLEIGFICQERPDKDIPFNCKLSDEVKSVNYPGEEIQKIEYTGYSLEKFYEIKGAKFYLHDLRPPKKTNQDNP